MNTFSEAVPYKITIHHKTFIDATGVPVSQRKKKKKERKKNFETHKAIPNIMEHIYSETLEPGKYQTFGFCQDPRYIPRRHKDQHLARAGSRQAKTDCEALIGHYHRPTCESSVGHSVAMVMPECIPARIETMGYFMEAIFYMDNIAESGSQDDTGSLANEWADTMPGSADKTTTISNSERKADKKSNTGAKQVVAKLALQLLLIDQDCAKNVMEAWKEWAKGFNKPRRFDSVEQYMQYRVVDSGAIVAVHLMNWAMGLNISVEDLRQIADIVDHAARALSYQNDFFSFNYEHDMFVELGGSSIGIANAVFVLADTEGLDLKEAKNKVAQLGQEHENAVLRLRDERWEKVDHKLRVCLDGIVDMVVGNLVWSASSDRYSSHRKEKEHMELPVRPKNSERKESTVQVSLVSPPTPPHDSDHEDDSSDSAGLIGEPIESLEVGMKKLLEHDVRTSSGHPTGEPSTLGDELVLAPIKYLESLPSKGFREAIVDGMDGWLHLPTRSISTIKDVVKHVHTASLLCDDMEDSSPLRRGQPSAHTIFGAPQTVNSTSYLWTLALDRLSELQNPQCLRIFIDEVRQMQIGQSWDLYWTAALECPREEEYLAMIDMSTSISLYQLTSHH